MLMWTEYQFCFRVNDGLTTDFQNVIALNFSIIAANKQLRIFGFRPFRRNMFNIPILDRILKVILNGRRKHLLSDKLNSVLTPCILIFFSIIISSKQLIGNPINCIIPQEFKTVWDNYVENYCFLAKVYHVSIKEPIPFNSTERNERSFSFYSWIPIILTIQALIFSIPLLIWDYFTENTLINYQKFLTDDQKEGFFRFYMKNTRNTVQFKRLYLTLLYFLIKLFYILNILFQFFTLSRFFGFDFLQWGYRVFTEDDLNIFFISIIVISI